ncbi:MAG: efflux RND transporter periplasmic adaptor subunit [Verrucomicrobia bacterium]|nr:efflux RND transporter periplasmic adaptor subunit [Verrucomicrobiota bacterium]
MKRLLIILALACIGLTGVFLALHSSSAPKTAAEKQLYTCGMHPQIIQDHPGNCPICEMKLQPVLKKAEQPSGPASDNATITIDPATIQTMGVTVGEVTEGPLKRSIRTVGVVDFNETALTDVTAKFKGWIEKLFVDASGRAVKKGEPLFETYSPDVYNAGLEFASLTRSGNTALAKTTLERLSLLGVAASELEKLKLEAQPSRTITMYSPADGVVVEKTAVEGMMFEPGMTLYRLADLSLVWLKAQIYEQDMAFVQLGQEAVASIDSLPGRKFVGRVTYVYPTLDPKTRTAQVRMEFHNPGLLLKPGMFAKVELEARISPSATLVPESAVLRSGDRATVFVALDGGRFDPREVVLGPRDSSARYQVLQGLSPGEKVVTSAQFMFDSESQLREAIQKMQGAHADSRPAELPAAPVAAQHAPPEPPKTFVCPMPEHASIEYDHGGKCPICSMTLIPGTATSQPAATPADHAQSNH